MPDSKTEEQLADVTKHMNLQRTSDLFDTTIERAKANDKTTPLGDEQVKQMRVVLGAGSLHVRVAQAILGAVRLSGYLDNTKRMKLAIEKKAKDALRRDAK